MYKFYLSKLYDFIFASKYALASSYISSFNCNILSGIPIVYQHPSLHPAYRLDHRFTPADIHRPSYLHLFQRSSAVDEDSSSRPGAQIEEGQFDDLEPSTA